MLTCIFLKYYFLLYNDICNCSLNIFDPSFNISIYMLYNNCAYSIINYNYWNWNFNIPLYTFESFFMHRYYSTTISHNSWAAIVYILHWYKDNYTLLFTLVSFSNSSLILKLFSHSQILLSFSFSNSCLILKFLPHSHSQTLVSFTNSCLILKLFSHSHSQILASFTNSFLILKLLSHSINSSHLWTQVKLRPTTMAPIIQVLWLWLPTL